MTERPPVLRWVIDTNVLVSWVLRPHGVAARAVRRAADLGRLLFSTATHEEMRSVMQRAKFDAYVPLKQRLALLLPLDDLVDWVVPTRSINACRDPKDNKFLDVAVHGGADALITGDADLLVLHPFMNVRILSPEAFLASEDWFGPRDAKPELPRLLQEPGGAHYAVRKRHRGATTKA
ncbi:putative toxin-antitoxin system toxin component, PIN family [Variovorax sp. KK3]|uniref:putative toxin-antitoxin system toxin component, PIN family n=1 Tax=Variovorax sp. KK3 TaxID=1855728 RepID=UPI00097C2839|nr:putative toxin-antitoxin system toxin component, PIN family [Variovorax sp. KK3]